MGSLGSLTSFVVTDAYMEKIGWACVDFNRTDIFIIDAFMNLTRLETLKMDSAKLTGSLPSNIGNLRALNHLELRSALTVNRFTGVQGFIPASFWHLQEIRTLLLENTNLIDFEDKSGRPLPELRNLSLKGSASWTGDVSSLIKGASELEMIDLSTTSATLNGAVLDSLPSLTYLDLSFSKVNWTITYTFWRTSTKLEYLALIWASGVDGIISEDIGQLSYLKQLLISNCGLSGSLPSSIVRCPLQTLSIEQSFMWLPIPQQIGDLNATLTVLRLSDLSPTDISGAMMMPSSLGALTRLVELRLQNNGLMGPIPLALADAIDLKDVHLDNNKLTGPLPALTGLLHLNVMNNQLNGTIPASIAATAETLFLSYNDFGPRMDVNLFIGNKKLMILDASRNRFSGLLPHLGTSGRLNPKIDLSFNQFTGSIPDSFCTVTELKLSNNLLTGAVNSLLDQRNCSLEVLDLNYNQLLGSIPDLSHHTSLKTLSISFNRFSGKFPLLPRGLKTFAASSNRFVLVDSSAPALPSMRHGCSVPKTSIDTPTSPYDLNMEFMGDINESNSWMDSPGVQGLQYLDISSNYFETDRSFMDLIGPKLSYLSLANNRLTYLSGSVKRLGPFPALVGLDLTNTSSKGSFFFSLFPSLTVLKLANNYYVGTLPLDSFTSLTQLDISDNLFEFNILTFASHPLLTYVNASKNNLFGPLVLENLPNLQTADFSWNDLTSRPSLASISTLFVDGQLQLLDISNNSFPTLDISDGLHQSTISAPSIKYPSTVTCYQLAFNNKSNQRFIYDENLFQYRQCDCNSQHFGSPPSRCLKCPSSGVSSCGGAQVNVTAHSYAFFHHNSTESTPLGSLELMTESCLVTVIQSLSGKSNCKGIRITASDVNSFNGSWDPLLATQCDTGSEGRLCSKCTCNDKSCWFLVGPTCSKCRRVFSISTWLPGASVLLVLGIIVLSVIMAFILRRKRIQSLESFDKLPLWKRIFYRFLYLTTLGNVSILITFLQILIEFTQWDAYMRVEFLSILNGGGEKIGIRCVFPFLKDPLLELLANLSVPFIAVGIVALSVGIGGALASLMDAKKKGVVVQTLESEESDEKLSILAKKHSEIVVEYPTLALMTSVSITIVKFFYFGTAISAHEYLFSSQQAYGIKYVQNRPWLKYSDALSLILTSIPAILIFDLGIPLAFVAICWKYRHTFRHRSVQIYFGSLFETYNSSCFWWEIVNTLKKLAVALVLQGIPSSSAVQSALVISILAVVQLSQLSLNPWRRRIENISDGASSLILIAALLYTRPGQLSQTSEVLWYIFALSAAFVVLSLIVIVWQTVTGTTDYEKQLNHHLASMELNTQEEGSPLDKNWNYGSESDFSLQ